MNKNPRQTATMLVGKKINKLTVKRVERRYDGKSMRTYLICDCECGKKDLTLLYDNVIRGKTKSCGCELKRFNQETLKIDRSKFDDLEELSNSGMSYTAIAKHYGIGIGTLRKIRQEKGLL